MRTNGGNNRYQAFLSFCIDIRDVGALSAVVLHLDGDKMICIKREEACHPVA